MFQARCALRGGTRAHHPTKPGMCHWWCMQSVPCHMIIHACACGWIQLSCWLCVNKEKLVALNTMLSQPTASHPVSLKATNAARFHTVSQAAFMCPAQCVPVHPYALDFSCDSTTCCSCVYTSANVAGLRSCALASTLTPTAAKASSTCTVNNSTAAALLDSE